MTRLVIAEKEELVRRLRSRVEECLDKVLASVNAARDGHLIEDSEKTANDLLNELKRQVYEEALQTRIDATEASFSPPADAQGRPWENKGRRSCSRLALPGRVATSRRRYQQPGVGSVSPLDEVIDAAGRAVTLGVSELACRLALDAASFQRAGECLLAAAGLRMSDETLRVLVLSEGRWVVAAQEAEQLELDWHASDCPVASPGGPVPAGGPGVTRLYLGCDGVLVPMVTHQEKQKRRAQALERRGRLRRTRGQRRRPLPAMKRGADDHYKEMKLVTFYDQDRSHRLVRATRKDCRQAGKLMRQGMVGLRILGARERIALVDGAPWIAKQVRQRRPPFTALTLDFWHLSEHVHGARRQVFGEADAAGLAWAAEALTLVRERGYEPFWEVLTQWRSRQRSPRKRQAVDDLLHYVSQRRDMINYPLHQARGWDIGSGPTESMCKALTRRIKGVGMRWDAPHAEAMMSLEALLQSHQWSSWWQYRHRQAA